MIFMPRGLTYAPMPPPDRVDVVWQGNEFDITIPPRFTLRGIFLLLVIGLCAAVCCHLAFNPMAHTPPLARGVAGVCGVASALLGVAALRQARTWTRLSLCKGRLECSIPSLRGFEVKRFVFSSFVDASVGPSQSQRDHGTYLLMRRHSGEVEQVLENVVYRVSDLEIVAAAIREAIRRRATEPD